MFTFYFHIFAARNHAALAEKEHQKVGKVKKKRAKTKKKKRTRVNLTRDNSVINLKSMRFQGLPSMGLEESDEWS